jgi:aryl-alcohol dehydrogenase-like predicted oxidoreductase
MKNVQLGRSGEQVNRLALGAMLMGTATDEATSRRMLDDYLARGGSFLDTANCYAWWVGNGENVGDESEATLGRWFAATGRRDEVFLATKGSARIGPDGLAAIRRDGGPATPHYEGAGGETLRRAIDASLQRLQTDHVDLYYVHVDDRATPLEETLSALADIVAAGKARHIGWSNVRTWRLERIRALCAANGWPQPVAVQQQHTFLPPRDDSSVSIVGREQLDYLQERDDLTLVAYSPILKGVYDDPAKRHGHPVMASYDTADAEKRISVLETVATEVGCTPNQLVVAWQLHQTAPELVTLVGPRTWEQYESAMAAHDVTLSEDQLARLDEAAAR